MEFYGPYFQTMFFLVTMSCIEKLSALSRGVASKDFGDFYCLNYFILLKQKANFNLKKAYGNQDFCGVIVSLRYYSLINTGTIGNHHKTDNVSILFTFNLIEAGSVTTL